MFEEIIFDIDILEQHEGPTSHLNRAVGTRRQPVGGGPWTEGPSWPALGGGEAGDEARGAARAPGGAAR